MVALHSGKELFRSVVQTTADPIFSIDSDGRIVFWNRAAELMLGYAAAEVIGKPVILILPEQLQRERPDDLGRLPVRETSGVVGRTVEQIVRRKDGTKFPAEISLGLFKTKEGTFFTGIIRDLTERKQIEHTLLATHDELERRVRERTEALARANADLRREITQRQWAEYDLKESYRKLQATLKGAVEAMAMTVEMRDPYTAGHQRRVADLAAAIAADLGHSDEQVAAVRLAGTLHDVGKIGTPAEILSRPGRLDPLEFALVKGHPQVGHDIVKRVDFPWPIAEIVVQHHERLDGSGYPSGLSADAILPEAKVLAVADVVEAMASHRPYRPALGIEQALAEIRRHRGTLYDQQVADSCLRLFAGGFQLT